MWRKKSNFSELGALDLFRVRDAREVIAKAADERSQSN